MWTSIPAALPAASCRHSHGVVIPLSVAFRYHIVKSQKFARIFFWLGPAAPDSLSPRRLCIGDRLRTNNPTALPTASCRHPNGVVIPLSVAFRCHIAQSQQLMNEKTCLLCVPLSFRSTLCGPSNDANSPPTTPHHHTIKKLIWL